MYPSPPFRLLLLPTKFSVWLYNFRLLLEGSGADFTNLPTLYNVLLQFVYTFKKNNKPTLLLPMQFGNDITSTHMSFYEYFITAIISLKTSLINLTMMPLQQF